MRRPLASIVALGGLLACTVIVATFAGMLLFSLLEGPHLELEDLVGGGVFGGLSFVVVLIVSLASVREWQRPTSGGEILMRGAPVVLVAGLGLGVYAASSLRDGREEWRAEGEQYACRLAPVFQLEPAVCAQKAKACAAQLYTADPPTVEALARLRAVVMAENEAASLAEKAHEQGAESRGRLAMSMVSDISNPGWLRRYRLGLAACVGGLLP